MTTGFVDALVASLPGFNRSVGPFATRVVSVRKNRLVQTALLVTIAVNVRV